MQDFFFFFEFFRTTFTVAYGNFYRQPEPRKLLNGQQAIITPFSKYIIRSKYNKAKLYHSVIWFD